MAQRDYSKIEEFDIFRGKGSNTDNPPSVETILDVDENDIPHDLADYLPFDDGSCEIVQKIHPTKKFIFQKLTGNGWSGKMVAIAAKLRMDFADKPVDEHNRPRIIDDNITDVGNSFGEQGRWKIQAWEVIANFTGNGDRDGRFIDRITWVKVEQGNTVETFSSTHEWRIY